MESTEFCPRPLTRQDATALIGILAVLEGQLMSGNLDPEAAERLRSRMADDGLLEGDEANQDVPATLEALNQRVRFALGE
jgi:hypothetical protein